MHIMVIENVETVCNFDWDHVSKPASQADDDQLLQ